MAKPELKELITELKKHFPDFDGAVIFERRKGQLLMNPIVPVENPQIINGLANRLKEYAGAIGYFIIDLAKKTGKGLTPLN